MMITTATIGTVRHFATRLINHTYATQKGGVDWRTAGRHYDAVEAGWLTRVRKSPQEHDESIATQCIDILSVGHRSTITRAMRA